MGSNGHFLAAAVTAASLLASPLGRPTAWSQPAKPSPEQIEIARAHYTAAEAAVSESRWADALREYQGAYDITHDPVLFFKLATTHESAGNCTQAILHFKRYLDEGKPSEEYRRDTESRIAACKARQMRAAEEDSKADPELVEPEISRTSSDENPIVSSGHSVSAGNDDENVGAVTAQPLLLEEELSWQQKAGWTSVGFTVAFVSAGAIFGLSARSREEDLDNLLRFTDSGGRPATFDDNIQEQYDELKAEGKDLNRFALVSFGLAGASAAAAVAFFLLDDGSNASDGDVVYGPTFTESGAGASATWRF